MFRKLMNMVKVPSMNVVTSFAKKNMMLLIIGAIVAAVIYYLVTRKPEVMPYEGFQSEGESKPKLIFVYATWCPHCKTVLPEMKDLEAQSPIKVGGKECEIVIIESEEKDKLTALNHKVEGYPTFLLQDAAGTMHQYEGERNRDAIVAYVTKMLGA
jgi:thiol-disulfide isomerase/thioredoxin